MSEHSDDDGSEYRPTDYLAVCGFSYGIGHAQDQAVLNALRYAGPFEDDRDDPVEVAVWELYADSWQTHGPTGPERSAEQLSFEEWQLPRELADEASKLASDARSALSTAYHEGEKAREDAIEAADS